MGKISSECLGLAAEFAVASELCRRGMYAQLTLGHRKRTDILVEVGRGSILKLEVKGKQDRTWPNCRGTYGHDSLLVLVDFANKGHSERPDFYVLTADDWRSYLETALHEEIALGKVLINDKSVPVWPEQLLKNGRPYEGCAPEPSQLLLYKERWESIARAP